jgi:hypothetical protein
MSPIQAVLETSDRTLIHLIKSEAIEKHKVGAPCENTDGCSVLAAREGGAQGKPILGHCVYPTCAQRCKTWLTTKLNNSGYD